MKPLYSVSFVMPMFNESENITTTIAALKSIALEIASSYEIVVTDDASTDNSVEVVRGLSEKDSRIKLFCLDRNTKFGGAFAECFKRATGDIIMYLDSDMPVTIEDIKQSIALIEKADIINGCSKVKKGDSAKRKFISWAYNLMVRTLFGLKVKDINSGFKIVRRELVKDIEFLSSSPFIDVELFLHARKKNARVEQYPLIFQTRTGGVSHIARIPIIMATFWDMIKVRLLR